jgi:hypothetical protein
MDNVIQFSFFSSRFQIVVGTSLLEGYLYDHRLRYFWRLIGKLTVFLQLQEFSLRKQTPSCTITVV